MAQARKDYGVRVQKSVFECVIGKAEWTVLRDWLLHEFSPAHDSLRFYFLDEVTKARTEHHGHGKPLDVESTLIV